MRKLDYDIFCEQMVMLIREYSDIEDPQMQVLQRYDTFTEELALYRQYGDNIDYTIYSLDGTVDQYDPVELACALITLWNTNKLTRAVGEIRSSSPVNKLKGLKLRRDNGTI